MIKTINERISATGSFASKLKDLLAKATNEIERSIASKKESNVTVVTEPVTISNMDCNDGVGIIKYASLTALTIGGVGWLASAALWSKMMTFGGVAGLVYCLINNISAKHSPQTECQPHHSSGSKMSPSFIADQASVVINTLKEISNLWADFADSSTDILNQKIRNSSLNISSHERFKLESLIRVPKILSFPLIEYRNILENANSADTLKKAVDEVAENSVIEIDRVIISQIRTYNEMIELILKDAR